MQGVVEGEEYAVKLYDNRQPEAIKAYFHEKKCLQALGACASIVDFKMAGRLQDTLYPCIVTSFAGSPVSRLSRHQRRAANQASDGLHVVGAAHGDIRLPNLLFKQDGSCHSADLAHCVMEPSQEEKQQDKSQLSTL